MFSVLGASPGRLPLRLLARLGRLGPKALAAQVLAAVLLPWLGRMLENLLGLAVFLLLTTAFLRMDMARARGHFSRPLLLTGAVLWISLALPLLLGGGCVLAGMAAKTPDLYLALIFQAAASPIMASPAFAALLGLDGTFVLITLLFTTVLVPLTSPLLMELLLVSGAAVSPLPLAGKLALLLCGSALLAAVLRAALGRERIAGQAEAIDGVNLILVFIFAAVLMKGVGPALLADPLRVIGYGGLALLVCCLLFTLSYVVFRCLALSCALEIAVTASLRNMGLMLAAAGPLLPEPVWLYFALAQFPIFFAPLLLQPFVTPRSEKG